MLTELLVTLMIPLGLDMYLPSPEENPLTAEKIELGRQLFFDKRLSRDQSVSCATCHDPERGFADGNTVAIGIGGRQGRRNAPALINRGYGRVFSWDGRSRSLEEQVLTLIEDEHEMGFSIAYASARVRVPPGDMARALSSFVRSILSGNSPFDRFVGGDRSTLTADAQAGLRLFRGKANCAACHVGPNLSDERLHNTGVAWRGTGFADQGGGRGDFRTPTLREITRTAPYMHDGSVQSLEKAVEFYNQGGRFNPALDAEIRPLQLLETEKAQLVAFLRALSGTVQAGRHRPAGRPGGLQAAWEGGMERRIPGTGDIHDEHV